jgi:hypothetical protein
MSKSISTLEGHVSSLIETRRATKDARFKPLPAGVERAADVVQGALAWLQDRLAVNGFKSAPSQLQLTRRFGEITQAVGFQAMSTNLSGVSVQVVIHASVKAASRKRWTAAEGTRYGSAYLWSRQVGYLGGEHDYFQWELVDPATRETALEDMLHKIKTLALPALDSWTSKAAIGEAVFRGTEQDRPDWLVETALWAGHHEAALRLLRELLVKNPRLVPDYCVNLSLYQSDQAIAEPFLGDPANGLAFLAARYGLQQDVPHDNPS